MQVGRALHGPAGGGPHRPFELGQPHLVPAPPGQQRGRHSPAAQAQQLALARLALVDPPVAILDEATASLDIPSERLIQGALQSLLADRTAIIIAHRLSTVAIADRVLVMEHGRIIEDDTPAALIAGTGKFAQLHAAWRESLV